MMDIEKIPLGHTAAAAGDWLVGGGEMANVVKAMDWSRSPLGPIESWPQSLRTTVSLAQASNAPMSLAWGAGHVQIYNDGYWPLCGTKHPSSMGQDFRECWASAFPVLGAAYASAWSGKSAYLENMRMFLDRYGFLEETWFTFSFSPVTDESGNVGGVFHPVTEMTSQMLAERRSKTMRELASGAAKARTSDDAFSLCSRVLAEAELDLPFFLLYVVDAVSRLATLVGRTGLPAGSPHSPGGVDTRSLEDSPWGIANVARTGVASQVDDVRARLADQAVGPYPEQPKTALILPLFLPGSDLPAAVIVLGLSPRLILDEPYRGFCELVLSGVSTALAGARAYEEERSKVDALAQLDRAKMVFFSNVSHEFRTPLTLVLGPVEDALVSGNLSGENLKAVHRGALRLLRLVDSLLDFSRIEGGGMRSAFVPTDLAVLTTELAESFLGLLTGAALKLVVDCPPLAELVYVDREHWAKIVLNLLSNAFKFTFEGEIAVRLRAVEGHLELTVSDTGTGISAKELPKVFARFHRVEGARGRSIEGTGIGLAMVDELVKAHGGSVRAQSIVGTGTTFVVSIPFGAEHLPQDQVSAKASSATTNGRTSSALLEAKQWLKPGTADPHADAVAPGRQRILVADDNADMREYLGRLLTPHWDVELVDDGQKALDSALARPPDVILTDVMMPGLDGVALLKALREDTRTAATPVVLLSARAGEEALLEGLETLADDYIVKPFSARELLTRVRGHLRMSSVRQRLQSQLVIADRMSAVGLLAAGVAHEINNPLAYVLSNLELIAEEIRELAGGSPSRRLNDLDDMVSEARQGAERVRKIVRGMKTFARGEEERRLTLDIRPLLELSVNMAFSEIKHRARVVKDFGKTPLVQADEARLAQVFVNLLVNAAHSIAEGNADKNEIRIATRTDASGRCVVEIRDTGRGIPAPIIDRIFDPFFTTKDIGEGTGLGLSICHGIVQALRGEITVESVLGKGSTFRITLPAADLEIHEPSVRPASRQSKSPSGRVLVVDDDVMVGATLRRVLGKEHDLTVLSSGQEALALLLGGTQFDVILCDLMMPVVTGMDIYAALAGALPEVSERMVFVTGGAFTPAGQTFLDTVPNQRIEKPFSPQNVRAVVHTFMGGALRSASAYPLP